MKEGMHIKGNLDEFNRVIFYFQNNDVKFEDEDYVFILLCYLP